MLTDCHYGVLYYYIQTSVYYQHRLSPSYLLINKTKTHVKLKLKHSLSLSTTKGDKEVPGALRPSTSPLDQGYQLHVRRVRP